MPVSPERRARNLLADAVGAQGPKWKNAADLLRSSDFANIWITPALVVIAALIAQLDALKGDEE